MKMGAVFVLWVGGKLGFVAMLAQHIARLFSSTFFKRWRGCGRR